VVVIQQEPADKYCGFDTVKTGSEAKTIALDRTLISTVEILLHDES